MNTTKNELQGKINGLINANNYLLSECEENPRIAPYLQVIIDNNQSEIEMLSNTAEDENG